MIAIVDYGVGNLFSLKSSLAFIGADAIVTSDEALLRSADKIILPGVGAFGDAAKKLRECGLDKVVKDEAAKGKPIMGICLGMQLLLEKGYEYGEHEGLGLIKGEIRPIADAIPKDLKIPHIGWNSLDFQKDSPLFKYIQDGDFVYFVHSYYPELCPDTIATTKHGVMFSAALKYENFYGTQFHPEKSGDVGERIIENFLKL